MTLLNTLGGLAGGLSQGFQQGRNLAAQAQQIQMYQQQIDAAKRDLAAQAAVFQGMQVPQAPTAQFAPAGGGQQPPPPQGAPPGPVAPPNMQSPAPGPVPPAPGQASVPGGPRPPTVTGGPPPAPGPVQQSGPAPQPQAPAGVPGVDPNSQQFDPFAKVMQIAAQIKQNNPGIDPQTLFAAVGDMVKLSQGVAPDMRSQMMYAAQMMRGYLTERGQNMTYQARMAQIANSAQQSQARIQAANQRTTYIQNNITQRFQQGQFDKKAASAARDQLGDASAKLKVATNNYNQLLADMRAGVEPAQSDDGSGNMVPNPKFAAAQKALDDALGNFDSVSQSLAGQATGGGAPAPTSGQAQTNIPDSIPLPKSLQGLREGEHTDKDQNGIVWMRKGDTLQKVKTGG